MYSRRDLLKDGIGLAGILATGKAPALVKSIIAATNTSFSTKAIPSAMEYIQDGLVALWDARENVGWGEHNPDTALWKNLAGDSVWDMPVQSAWVDGKGLYFDGTWCGIAPKRNGNGELTIETTIGNIESDFSVGWSYAGGACRPSMSLRHANKQFVGYNLGAEYKLPYPSQRDSRHIAVVYHGTSLILYAGQSMAGDFTITKSTGWTTNRFRLAGYGTAKDASKSLSKGTVYRCAIYSRALDADEVAHNYEIDRARFKI